MNYKVTIDLRGKVANKTLILAADYKKLHPELTDEQALQYIIFDGFTKYYAIEDYISRNEEVLATTNETSITFSPIKK